MGRLPTNNLALESLARSIRLRRRARKWSQERLAELAGVTQGTISAVETSKTFVSLPNLIAIADALDCNFLELFLPPDEPSLDTAAAELSPEDRALAVDMIRSIKRARHTP